MSEIDRKIKNARPRLGQVAPLSAGILWGYGAINLVLGLGMMFLYSTPVALAVADILNYQVWGGLFLLTGVLTVWGLVANNWWLTRNTQLLGMLLKSIWLIALIIRCVTAPQTILITAVWFFLVYVQALVYIHFVPLHGNGSYNNGR